MLVTKNNLNFFLWACVFVPCFQFKDIQAASTRNPHARRLCWIMLLVWSATDRAVVRIFI